MTRSLIILAPALVLAGCNSSPSVEVKNASVSEVAQKVQEARQQGSFVSPGKWRVTTTIKEMNIPGMPPQALAQMQAQMNKPTVNETCITKEQAEKPSAEMLAGQDNGQCRFEKFTMGSGKIDAVMHCQPQQGGGAVTMTMDGVYAPDTYTMKAAMERPGPDGSKMSMKIENSAQRIGECGGDKKGEE